ncbi:hypothetical protein [Novosphingobium sp. FKTRR1]|uniref:hypothetical protein n=1 Tax=unclassified Novosphingobium TaxID=2644732 RepID=UPI001CF03A73|nr:hypothetical protein [Novosphingobium sp. FKTRR1]
MVNEAVAKVMSNIVGPITVVTAIMWFCALSIPHDWPGTLPCSANAKGNRRSDA